MKVEGTKAVSLQLSGMVAGQYKVDVKSDGLSQTAVFTAKEEGTVNPPEPGKYPPYAAGTAYAAGDKVTGADGNTYECKPWPFTGWCANASYAPGETPFWTDAWDKI